MDPKATAERGTGRDPPACLLTAAPDVRSPARRRIHPTWRSFPCHTSRWLVVPSGPTGLSSTAGTRCRHPAGRQAARGSRGPLRTLSVTVDLTGSLSTWPDRAPWGMARSGHFVHAVSSLCSCLVHQLRAPGAGPGGGGGLTIGRERRRPGPGQGTRFLRTSGPVVGLASVGGRWSSVAIVDTTRARPAGVLVPGPQVPPTTVIVPTRNESGNVRELLRRLVPSLPTGSEVLFVDDSDDDTVQVIEAAAVGLPVRVRVHHREVDDRADGLGGAVRAGLEGAGCEWCVVMDADLQHPPELVPQLVEAGVAPTASSSWRAGTAVGAGMLPAQPRPSGPVLVGHSSDEGFFPDGSPTCPTPCRDSSRFADRLSTCRPFARTASRSSSRSLCAVGPLRTAEVPFHFGERYSGREQGEPSRGAPGSSGC